MHRTDGVNHSSNTFTEGPPGTQITDDWLNDVQGELCNAIEADGTTLVKGTSTQLRSVLASLLGEPGGRLTLTTALPVTTSDVSSATTVRYTPYKHNRVAIYNGTNWNFHTFAELTQATTDNTKSPAAVANNSNYDVFVWNDAGTLRATRGPAWTSGTNRGTGAGTADVERFEGRVVNKEAITNGPAARRGTYVGTIRSDGSAQINDTLATRHVWNQYHRVARPMKAAAESTDTWTQTTEGVWRQARNSSANQLNFLIGLAEDLVNAQVIGLASHADAGVSCAVGIGIDSTTVNSAGITAPRLSAYIAGGDTVDVMSSTHAVYNGFPGLGSHFLSWLEWVLGSGGGGNATWRGDGGQIDNSTQAGITGWLMA